MNWPNEPPALTTLVAMARRAGATNLDTADINTAGPAIPAPPGHARTTGRQHADGQHQAQRAVHQRNQTGADGHQQSPQRQHTAGAVLVGHDTGQGLRQAPPQLAKRKGQADTGHTQAGGGVDAANKQAHRLPRAHGQRKDACGGGQHQPQRAQGAQGIGHSAGVIQSEAPDCVRTRSKVVVDSERGPMTPTLEAWMQAEQRSLAMRQTPAQQPPLSMEELLALDGLAQMQAMLAGRSRPPSIGHTMDFFLVEVERGRALFQGQPGGAHLNPMGAVHGGWYATILDSALGCAVHTAMPVGKAYTTLELKINIVRALPPAGQPVRAEGQVIHVGGQTATADARLLGADGKLYAHGSTTCLVFDARQRPPSHSAQKS
jgi:uncharacterized protein (TIGR00369 family)